MGCALTLLGVLPVVPVFVALALVAGLVDWFVERRQ